MQGAHRNTLYNPVSHDFGLGTSHVCFIREQSGDVTAKDIELLITMGVMDDEHLHILQQHQQRMNTTYYVHIPLVGVYKYQIMTVLLDTLSANVIIESNISARLIRTLKGDPGVVYTFYPVSFLRNYSTINPRDD